jgi:two-component system, OmpR family, sensor kinase
MPIRWRLTLWFGLILCVTLIVSGVVIYTLLQHSLYSDVDTTLRLYSNEVHTALDTSNITDPTDYDAVCSCLPSVDRFASPGIYIQLADKNGNIRGKSDNLGDQYLPVDQAQVAPVLNGDVRVGIVTASDGTRLRVMDSPLTLGNQTLVVEVGHSLKQIDNTMSSVRWAILGGVLAALALVGISGGVLVRRALSPVGRITRTAQNIELSSDLSRRVGYKGPMDEVGQLATTFDHMIEHLERDFEAQKHFIADASHDLRSPLTVLRGNLDLLKRKLSEEERQESLKAMEGEAERMGRIVNDLLLLTEVESGQLKRRELVSLKDILLEGAARGQQLLPNTSIVIGRLEDLSVMGDAYMLNRLLSNLIDNAIAYTPEGGVITLSLYRDGDQARLEVADNGRGIAPEHLPHIFDRFYRVDQARSRIKGGSGLGLAIVKAIAEQHQGKVTVTSEPGKGSTFTVSFRL